MTLSKQVIVMVYFSFTSLTTVGFGDYHPKSNVERTVISMALLFGVMLFSFFMGNFAEILDNHSKFQETTEEGDLLYKFFGVLKKYNDYIDIDVEIKRKIENYFDFRWECDRNYFFIREGY